MQPSTSYTSSLSSSIISKNINPDSFASAASNIWGTSNSNLQMHSMVNQLSARSSPNNLYVNNLQSISHSIPRITNHSLDSINNATLGFILIKIFFKLNLYFIVIKKQRHRRRLDN